MNARNDTLVASVSTTSHARREQTEPGDDRVRAPGELLEHPLRVRPHRPASRTPARRARPSCRRRAPAGPPPPPRPSAPSPARARARARPDRRRAGRAPRSSAPRPRTGSRAARGSRAAAARSRRAEAAARAGRSRPSARPRSPRSAIAAPTRRSCRCSTRGSRRPGRRLQLDQALDLEAVAPRSAAIQSPCVAGARRPRRPRHSVRPMPKCGRWSSVEIGPTCG